jgi:hypothetical protein
MRQEQRKSRQEINRLLVAHTRLFMSEPDGKMKAHYKSWDELKVLLPGQSFEVTRADTGPEADTPPPEGGRVALPPLNQVRGPTRYT